MVKTSLKNPISKNGIPTDYWLLLSIMRNGEIYCRKEMISMTSVRAVRTLLEDRLITNIDDSGLYAISARGLAYFKTYKPIGTVKRIPRTVNYWKLLVKTPFIRPSTKTIDSIKTVFNYDTMKEAKDIARVLKQDDMSRTINIVPASN